MASFKFTPYLIQNYFILDNLFFLIIELFGSAVISNLSELIS